jgi:hypothetical protein
MSGSVAAGEFIDALTIAAMAAGLKERLTAVCPPL